MKKQIIAIALTLLCAGSVWGAEYWINNSPDGVTGTGTEKDPYSRVALLEAVIVPGSIHAIHLVGTNKPYEGGLGGYALKGWIFKNCAVIKDETKGTVLFYSTRTIPISLMSGLTANKTLDIHPKFNMDNRRFIRDGDNLLLSRPEYLGDNADDGFAFNSETCVMTLNVDLIPKKNDVDTDTGGTGK